MASRHSLINGSLASGSPSAEPHHLIPFPMRAFPEYSTEISLDLNSSQKLSQNVLKTQIAFEPDSIYQSDQKELLNSPNAQTEMGPQTVQDIALSDTFESSLDKLACDTAPSKIAQRSRCHWSHNEVMALFNAKVVEAEKYNDNVDNERSGKKMKISSERWDEVAEFCKSMGSNKLASQCKDKWERIWSAFRKIIDWEKQPPPDKRSFWVMQGEEREKEGFPRVFDRDLFDAMLTRFGSTKSIDVSTIVIDSSTFDESGYSLHGSVYICICICTQIILDLFGFTLSCLFCSGCSCNECVHW